MRPKDIPQGKTVLKILLIALALTASMVAYVETLPQTISTLETMIKILTPFMLVLYLIAAACIYLDTRQAQAANETRAVAQNKLIFLALTAIFGACIGVNVFLFWLR